MSDNKYNIDILLTDLLLRVTALENLLKDKNILTEEEIQDELKILSEVVVASVTKSLSKDSSELEDILNQTPSINKKKSN